ncbi:MAG: hypothetical protein KDB00_16480 [Planctomycetales bacterium]|nr:hypothetical protein [Planctomycetales bacterium]
MNRDTDQSAEGGDELSLEILDQWETELDQFAAGVMQRLSRIAGSDAPVRGLAPKTQTDDLTDNGYDDNSQAIQVLQSLREMTR